MSRVTANLPPTLQKLYQYIQQLRLEENDKIIHAFLVAVSYSILALADEANKLKRHS